MKKFKKVRVEFISNREGLDSEDFIKFLKKERKLMLDDLKELGCVSEMPIENESNGVITLGSILDDGTISIRQTVGGFVEYVYERKEGSE